MENCKKCNERMLFIGYSDEGHANPHFGCKCGQMALITKDGIIIWYGK